MTDDPTGVGALAERIYGVDTDATRQRVYRLIRLDLIPHVRLGPKTIRCPVDLYERYEELGGATEPGAWRRMLAEDAGRRAAAS